MKSWDPVSDSALGWNSPRRSTGPGASRRRGECPGIELDSSLVIYPATGDLRPPVRCLIKGERCVRMVDPTEPDRKTGRAIVARAAISPGSDTIKALSEILADHLALERELNAQRVIAKRIERAGSLPRRDLSPDVLRLIDAGASAVVVPLGYPGAAHVACVRLLAVTESGRVHNTLDDITAWRLQHALRRFGVRSGPAIGRRARSEVLAELLQGVTGRLAGFEATRKRADAFEARMQELTPQLEAQDAVRVGRFLYGESFDPSVWGLPENWEG